MKWTWTKSSSSACLSLLVLIAAPLAAGAQEEAEEQSAAAGEAAGEDLVGPPAPERAEPAVDRGTVLVLPSRTPVGSAADGATLDVLLASVLQELGFAVRDAAEVCRRLDADVPGLDQARDSYLDMDLEGALAAATAVRAAHLEHRGDLLADGQLEEAELFMIRVLIDLGRQDEAARLAARVLARSPGLRLDPADHSPTMLALWSATVLGQTGRAPAEPDPAELAAFGEEVGLDWVVVGVLRPADGGSAQLVVLVVPVTGDRERSRHDVLLGARAGWTGAVREALVERFPPPAPPPPVIPPGGVGAGGGTDDPGTAWYKSWWFWTTVGVVVVGAVAGGLGGYYGTREPEKPEVTSNVWAAQN